MTVAYCGKDLFVGLLDLPVEILLVEISSRLESDCHERVSLACTASQEETFGSFQSRLRTGSHQIEYPGLGLTDRRLSG
jgi:hypothetical protein